MRSWREATEEALYGPAGFYRTERPSEHFRTSVHNDSFAAAVVALLEKVDSDLGHPDPLDLVDVGAGSGELLEAVARASSIGKRLRLTAVEVRPRPCGLVSAHSWVRTIPPLTGLLIANEWLDNIPVDVAERDENGVDRLVLVDPATGDEALGPPVSSEDAVWLARWWPLRRRGDRAEIGAPRDAAWTAAVAQVQRGLAIAIDYGHLAEDRPHGGTLTAYRAGRQVRPIPDGSCDITAHVAMDSLAAPGAELRRQREVLRALGISGARPPREQASADPLAYLHALAGAGSAAELTDPAGLGAFWWLLQNC